MSFARPLVLVLLVLVPLALWLYLVRRRRPTASVRFSDLRALSQLAQTHRPWAHHSLIVMRCITLALLVAILAGPRLHRSFEEMTAHGVDIMLAIDCSGSMKAADFKPKNRLHVAKDVVRDFILGRKHDRIGLVVFAGTAFTQCPLTLDYGILESFVERLAIGTVAKDGTAIGAALATSLNRLRESSAKSKIVILLTDGAENVEGLNINYHDAALLAQAVGVKVYTVAVGKDDEVPMPVDHPIFGTRYVWYRAELNEEALQEIANLTGGKYFRATDPSALRNIFETIDRLERSEVKIKHYTRYEELFLWLVIPALLFLVLELVLAHTAFRTLP